MLNPICPLEVTERLKGLKSSPHSPLQTPIQTVWTTGQPGLERTFFPPQHSFLFNLTMRCYCSSGLKTCGWCDIQSMSDSPHVTVTVPFIRTNNWGRFKKILISIYTFFSVFFTPEVSIAEQNASCSPPYIHPRRDRRLSAVNHGISHCIYSIKQWIKTKLITEMNFKAESVFLVWSKSHHTEEEGPTTQVSPRGQSRGRSHLYWYREVCSYNQQIEGAMSALYCVEWEVVLENGSQYMVHRVNPRWG